MSANKESNVHFASNESILSSNEESNIYFSSDESILSSNQESNIHFASDELILSSNEESNVRPIDDKDISCVHSPGQHQLKERVNSGKMKTKQLSKKWSSRAVSVDIDLPESFIINSSEISLSNKLVDSGLVKSKTISNLVFSATNSFDLNVISRTKGGGLKMSVKSSVEDVLSYILSNFDEGYCMINDIGFQSLFHEKSEEEILKWCEIQKKYFRLNVCKKHTMRIYPCFADVERCSLYWTRPGCKKEKCGKFHICKRLMLGEIHNHNFCTQNHSLENKKLKLLIKDDKLESLTDKQVLVLLRNKLPFVCSNYQINSCKEGNRHCPKLHICQNFVTKKCKKTEDICERDHETALTSNKQNALLKNFICPRADYRPYC